MSGKRVRLTDIRHPQVGKLGFIICMDPFGEVEILWDDGDCYWYEAWQYEVCW